MKKMDKSGKVKLWLWVDGDFPDWLRGKVEERYGTTYGNLSRVVQDACMNWFYQFQKHEKGDSSSSTDTLANASADASVCHPHNPHGPMRGIPEVKFGKKFDPRVKRKLQRMVNILYTEYPEEVTDNGISFLVNRICSRNGKGACARTIKNYMDIFLNNRIIVFDRRSETGVEIFRVNHDDAKTFQTRLEGYS